jgi:hypothetical protein
MWNKISEWLREKSGAAAAERKHVEYEEASDQTDTVIGLILVRKKTNDREPSDESDPARIAKIPAQR